ncbi:MAG TPA: NACHT domain-containing protein, partial [Pseudonocardiaceae bacterium]|nr:NACHT domain-containing protein [Pseudonocardiaceae bacterium]
MSGLEVPVLGLCAAVVRSTAKIWLGDREVAADAKAEAVDVLAGRLNSHLERRQLRRMFDRMEDIVAQRLAPLDLEYRAIPEHERLAALDAVRLTFQRAGLTDDDLFAADLDAGYVYRYLIRTVPGMAERALLSADATGFYDRLLRECCAYLVQITTTLPRCQTGVLTELLRRDTEIVELIRDVLTRMPQRRGLHDFEADYRLQVVTALDRVSFFGATLSEPSRKYPLSVAYISLTVSPDDIVVDADGDYDRADVAPVQRIEELLPLASHLFVRGEAGSGKTTLLQWIAVRCAAGDTRLANLGDRTPFLIRLRRYAGAPLPTPERFMDDVGRHVADEMPDGWIHQQLRSGRAIVLVDGVDELPEPRREDAREWLRELVATFPKSRFVVTSRPAAVAPGWLGGTGFVGAELRPLTPNDVRAFVHRWHDAMRAQSVDDDERAALDRYQELLTEGIAARRTLRRIAETPLLCALLCALHRDRHGHLPDNRMELYEITLHMLLERRDKERGIEPPAGLGRIEKTLLLQHLAYWLVLNGLSDAPEDRVVQQIAAKLELMPQVRADAITVFRHLLERTGLLRESVVARVDFVHRTFQEYLAAKAATDADHIGALVRNAHLDQWHEVVVMAAGHASPRQREELITGVIRRDDSRDRRYLNLLGLACLETSPELGTTLREEIHRRVRRLLPPRSPAAARSLAAGGEFVVDLLMRSQPKSLKEIRATIQAASYLGGDAAM